MNDVDVVDAKRAAKMIVSDEADVKPLLDAATANLLELFAKPKIWAAVQLVAAALRDAPSIESGQFELLCHRANLRPMADLLTPAA